MKITVVGHGIQISKTPEEIFIEVITPIAEQFRLLGLDVIEIKAEGLGM